MRGFFVSLGIRLELVRRGGYRPGRVGGATEDGVTGGVQDGLEQLFRALGETQGRFDEHDVAALLLHRRLFGDEVALDGSSVPAAFAEGVRRGLIQAVDDAWELCVGDEVPLETVRFSG